MLPTTMTWIWNDMQYIYMYSFKCVGAQNTTFMKTSNDDSYWNWSFHSFIFSQSSTNKSFKLTCSKKIYNRLPNSIKACQPKNLSPYLPYLPLCHDEMLCSQIWLKTCRIWQRSPCQLVWERRVSEVKRHQFMCLFQYISEETMVRNKTVHD